MDRMGSISNGCEVYENEEYLETVSVKEEPVSDEDADIPLDCLLCAKKLHTLSGLKAHVITHHNYKSVKRKSGNSPSPDKTAAKRQKHVCTICGRSFLTSTDLKVHEVCHNKVCCFACNAKFNSFKEVSLHRRRCKNQNAGVVAKPKTLSDILKERKALKQTENLTETHKRVRVKCLKCNEFFPHVESFKIHKLLRHGDKNALDNFGRKIEIEINKVVKQEQNAEGQENDKVVKDNKEVDDVKQKQHVDDQTNAKGQEKVIKNSTETVDYAKIETELESIFDIAVEKCQLSVKILEDETSITSEDTGGKENDDGQKKTIEEILKSPGLNQESNVEASTTILRDKKQTDKQLEDSNAEVDSNILEVNTDINMRNNRENSNNLSNEKPSEELKSDSSYLSQQRNSVAQFNKKSEDLNEQLKEVAETDPSILEINTDIYIRNNNKDSSNLLNEKPCEELKSDSSYLSQQRAAVGQNNKKVTAETLNDNNFKEPSDSILKHNKNTELGDPMDIEPLDINNTKTIENQDKENEGSEQQQRDTDGQSNKKDSNNKELTADILNDGNFKETYHSIKEIIKDNNKSNHNHSENTELSDPMEIPTDLNHTNIIETQDNDNERLEHQERNTDAQTDEKENFKGFTAETLHDDNFKIDSIKEAIKDNNKPEHNHIKNLELDKPNNREPVENKNSELDKPMDIEPIENKNLELDKPMDIKTIDTKTIEELDKENEKPEQYSYKTGSSDESNENKNVTTIQASAVKTSNNSDINYTDFIEKEDKRDDRELSEVILNGMENSEQTIESIKYLSP